jgi:maltose/moltooligosaccharide transporter
MERPRLGFWQIWNMSFGFFGIQFGWGLQMANMSAIYQYLHAKESDLPILWLAAPLTGLLVQPIIGYASDRTWGALGRRRPYFLAGAILASLALIAMPSSSKVWMAAGLLWVLDASVNITMEPFRAFVGDLLPEEQRKSGFAMQSLLIGLGAVLSSALPFMLVNGFRVGKESTVESPIPPAVSFAFYIGSGIFFASVLYTILTTKEHPPANLAEFEKMKRETAGVGTAFREIFGGIGAMPGAMRQLAVVQFFTWFALFCMWLYFVPAVAKGVFHGVPLGMREAWVEAALKAPEGQAYLGRGAAIARAYEARKSALEEERKRNAAPAGWHEPLLQMLGLKPAAPDASERIDEESLRALVASHLTESHEVTANEAESPLVQVFAGALLKHNVAQPEARELSAAALEAHRDLALARRYQEGAAWGGVCFSAYNGTAFVFAFVLLGLVKRFSARSIHRVCLICGGAGLTGTVGFYEPKVLICSMVLVGVAWASILSMPYAMLANAIPAQKMGFYMGVFNFFIVIPQILASLGLGELMKTVLGDNAMNAVLLGGCCMILAGLCVGLVPKGVDGVREVEPAEAGRRGEGEAVGH